MLILFDHVTPSGIAQFLPGHTVIKAKDRGWDTLTNGDLLRESERAGFDVLLTADKNMRYQQNLSGPQNRARGAESHRNGRLFDCTCRIPEAVDAATPGSYTEVEIPRKA